MPKESRSVPDHFLEFPNLGVVTPAPRGPEATSAGDRIKSIMRLCLALVALMPVGLLNADTIELKTGEKIEGVFKQAGSAGTVIEVGGQPVTFPMDKVRAIYLGTAPITQLGPPAVHGAALDALRGLRSIAGSGVSYRDYAPRVLDAKVIVDKYAGQAGDDRLAPVIAKAMQYFELASQAWGLKISGLSNGGLNRVVDIGKAVAPDLDVCPALRAEAQRNEQMRAQMKIKPPRNEMESFATLGMDMGNPAALWKCAGERVAEAEKMAAGK